MYFSSATTQSATKRSFADDMAALYSFFISENDIDMNSDDNVIVYTLHGSNTPMVYVSSDVSKKMGNAIITNEPTSCYYSFHKG